MSPKKINRGARGLRGRALSRLTIGDIKMTKDLTLGFGRFDPFTVGFDDMWTKLNSLLPTATAPTFPPYNIRKVNDNEYVIELAVAGFAKTDISVTLDAGKLVVKGATTSEDDSSYLHRGIATRAFERSWLLNDKVEVKDAEIVNGMLRIWLENMIKLQPARQIEVKEAGEKSEKKALKSKKELLVE